MRKRAVYKIPGGKMVRVALKWEENLIKDIKITGDFFLYPEEGINFLEDSLRNVRLEDALEKIKNVVKSNNLTLFGLTPEGIVETIKLAINKNE